ncbi:MAG: hypothetical protein KAJ51_12260, partial [Thermoplasmata archaeon]|nr:hypothetical protein [Thermoplasmata archaeon]
MKKEIPVILIITLLVATAILPAAGNENFDKTDLGEQHFVDEQEVPIAIGDDIDWGSQYQHDPQKFRYSRDRKRDFESNFIPRQLIIKFKEEIDISISLSPNNYVTTGISSIDALNEKYEVILAEDLFEEFSISGLSSIYKFIFSDDADINRLVKEYCMDPSVEYAEPNYINHLSPISFSLKNKLQGVVSISSNSFGSGLIPDD